MYIKEKIRHALCKVLDFSVIISQFIYPTGIVFSLKCSFTEHSSTFRTSNARFIDMADHSVAVHLLRGQRPLFLWQGGLEETLSRSGNERNRVKYDFIHHTHTQQPVDVVRLFRSDFCQIADVCCGFPPFVKHRYGIIRCDMIKGVFPYLIDAAIFKAQFLIRFAT